MTATKPRGAAPPASMTAPQQDPERPLVRVIIGRAAIRDLRGVLEDLEDWSSGSGRKLLRALERKMDQLQRLPESAPVDAQAGALPFGDEARARSTHVSGYVIRYVFPVQIEGEATLLVVSIRHGRRVPIDDAAFMKRFAAELLQAHVAKEVARSRGGGALPQAAGDEGSEL